MSVAAESVKASTASAPNFEQIKAKQQTTWASGNYAIIGATLQIVGESLAEAVDVRAGERVLDVAAGNGNATLAAARRFADVTSSDYVRALLDCGAARAKAEGFDVNFEVADAEALPYANETFDVALSTFGAMFTPDQRKTASEMLRVLRHGGRIGLANWTPEGFIGQLFKVIGKHVQPPAGLQPPALWGTEPHIVQLFGQQAADIRCTRKLFNFRYRSAEHWIQMFRDYYGPTHKAFGALDADGQRKLNADLGELLNRLNIGGPKSLLIPGEYLEVVIVKH